jgi:hypothetical protein
MVFLSPQISEKKLNNERKITAFVFQSVICLISTSRIYDNKMAAVVICCNTMF